MKRLLLVLILAAVLTATVVTPAFADEGKGNMGGKNAGIELDDPSTWPENPQGWKVGLVNGLYYHMARSWGSIAGLRNLLSITSGQHPAGCPW